MPVALSSVALYYGNIQGSQDQVPLANKCVLYNILAYRKPLDYNIDVVTGFIQELGTVFQARLSTFSECKNEYVLVSGFSY
jgi:hypothetical protein